MPALSDYTAGTITLTNGSVNFTGAGTGWQAADFREGDTILGIEDNAGVEYVIATITGNGAGTLTQEWEGATGTYAYRMRYMADGARVTAQARNLIELLGNGNLQALAGLTGPGVPVFNGPHAMTIKPEADFVNGVAYDVQVDTIADRAAYDGQSAGFAVLVSNMGDGRSALFSKASNASGDWTDPAYITGPTGPEPVVQATVDSLPPGSTATVTPTPIAGGVRLDFGLPEASGFYNAGVYNLASTYGTDEVVRHNGSSFIALQSVPAGTSPSSAFPPVDSAYWQVLATKGADGSGTGDVVGPSGAVGDHIAVFDGTTGKLIKDGGVTIGQLARDFKTVQDLIADETMGYSGSGAEIIVGEGDIITAQGFRYEVAAGDAVEFDEETAGGVRLVLKPSSLTDNSVSASKIDAGDILAIQRKIGLRPYRPRLIGPPSGFNWPLAGDGSGGTVNPFGLNGVTVAIDAGGGTRMSYPPLYSPNPFNSNPSANRTYYVSSRTGDNSNDGLTPATAFETISQALGQSTALHVILEPGQDYLYTGRWSSNPSSTTLAITVAGGGRARLVTGNKSSSWTSVGDGIHSTTNSNTVNAVVDTQFYDAFGAPRRLPKFDSLALLQAQSGEGWAQEGTTLYVRRPAVVTGATPAPNGTNIYILYAAQGPVINTGTGSARYYFEGLELWGGSTAFRSTSSTAFMHFKNCDFAYGYNGVYIDDARAGIVLQNCRSFSHNRDCFNYHNNSSTTPCFAIEDECMAWGAGFQSSDGIMNATTNHDNSRVIRVGGVYHSDKGPTLADVNDSQSWNIGCAMLGGTSGAGVEAAVEAWGSSGTGKNRVFLDGCYTEGRQYDLYAHAGGQIFVRDWASVDGAIFTGSGGGISPY